MFSGPLPVAPDTSEDYGKIDGSAWAGFGAA